mmetsp:Transcript_5767/g.24011  ORF Transcript_5767/g.24011 Transcript_5767/m.24011 type:complete len:612 (-) Transcript_5767:40-1875(-)
MLGRRRLRPLSWPVRLRRPLRHGRLLGRRRLPGVPGRVVPARRDRRRSSVIRSAAHRARRLDLLLGHRRLREPCVTDVFPHRQRRRAADDGHPQGQAPSHGHRHLRLLGLLRRVLARPHPARLRHLVRRRGRPKRLRIFVLRHAGLPRHVLRHGLARSRRLLRRHLQRRLRDRDDHRLHLLRRPRRVGHRVGREVRRLRPGLHRLQLRRDVPRRRPDGRLLQLPHGGRRDLRRPRHVQLRQRRRLHPDDVRLRRRPRRAQVRAAVPHGPRARLVGRRRRVRHSRSVLGPRRVRRADDPRRRRRRRRRLRGDLHLRPRLRRRRVPRGVRLVRRARHVHVPGRAPALRVPPRLRRRPVRVRVPGQLRRLGGVFGQRRVRRGPRLRRRRDGGAVPVRRRIPRRGVLAAMPVPRGPRVLGERHLRRGVHLQGDVRVLHRVHGGDLPVAGQRDERRRDGWLGWLEEEDVVGGHGRVDVRLGGARRDGSVPPGPRRRGLASRRAPQARDLALRAPRARGRRRLVDDHHLDGRHVGRPRLVRRPGRRGPPARRDAPPRVWRDARRRLLGLALPLGARQPLARRRRALRRAGARGLTDCVHSCRWGFVGASAVIRISRT